MDVQRPLAFSYSVGFYVQHFMNYTYGFCVQIFLNDTDEFYVQIVLIAQ